MLISHIIPQGTEFKLSVLFPDQAKVTSHVQVKHTTYRAGHYLTGLEFVGLDPEAAARIEKMSLDFVDCESRIQNGQENICVQECSFFSLCTKQERRNADIPKSPRLELFFEPPKTA